jgi:hypothetical protein
MPSTDAIEAEPVAAAEPHRPPEPPPQPARKSSGNPAARSMVRRPGKGNVTIRIGKWGMGMPELCRVQEVSESGVMFRRRETLEIGSEIEVDLSPHLSDRKFRRTAFVRRVLPVGEEFWIGCEFDNRASISMLAHLVR